MSAVVQITSEQAFAAEYPDACAACGAEIGEQCRPGCLGEAAHLDEADYYDDLPATCRWHGCTADAETRGFCDPHFSTL